MLNRLNLKRVETSCLGLGLVMFSSWHSSQRYAGRCHVFILYRISGPNGLSFQ